MKRKLIKKHLEGDPIQYDPVTAQTMYELRLAMQDLIQKYYEEHPEEAVKSRHGSFAYLPVRYAKGVKPYINTFTGKPILDGENILTRDGKVVLANSLDWLDWLAETGQTLPGLTLPEVHIEYNPKTKETRKYTGTSWEDMNASKTNAPIATSALWEELALENFEANDLIRLLMQKRLADRIANAKTPGVGSLALLGTFGTMAAWNPIAFAASLGAAKLGEATLNYPFLLYGYNSFGDWLFEGSDVPDWLKDNSNLGALLGGGLGWTLGKNLTSKLGLNLVKTPTLLADKYAPQWAAEEALIIANKNFLNNYLARMPLYVEDVPAVELSSSTPITSAKPQRPGVFYAKAGDINEGSLTEAGRNWQIRALAPGNPLEKRVNPLGLVSWKNIDWYLQRPSISAYDKWHITEALKDFPKDTPINYSELQEASKRLVPKFTLKPQTEYLAEGLNKINYGVNDIESMLVNSFHAPTVGNSGHYQDAFGHNRYFTSTTDKDVLYVSEILNDGAQLILLYVAGDPLVRSFGISQAINPQTIHMSETYPLRLIQEALLYALRLGKSKVRFPTRDTIYKIEKYDENIVLDELGERLLEALDNNWSLTVSTLESKYAPELKQLRTLKNQRFDSYRRASERLDKLCRLLQGAFPEGKISANLDYISLPDNFLGDGIASDLAMLMLRDAQLAKNASFKDLLDFSKKITEILRTKVYPKEEYIKANQEYINRTKYIEDNFGKPDDSNNIILDRYEAFPKHFRSLFGNKNDVRIVTDSKNNTWYEVDVPKDINTRTLLFSEIGDVNEGSLLSALLKGVRETNITKITGENFLDIPSSKIFEAYSAAKNVGLEQRAVELFRLYKEKLQIENGGKSLIPEDPKGHWLIRSLLPGNPLSKRVSPNGMVSLKNVEWYLRQPLVSAYDKTHISNALLLLPKINGLVNYNSLLRASSEIIPLLEPRPESEYAKVGLSDLGFNKVRYNPELRTVENPKETILPFTHSFHPQKGRLLPKSSRHYKDAYGHNRYFVDKLNPNTLNVLEILNDAALANLHQGLPLYKHMNDTFFLRLILEALLTAHNTGLDKVRFPTSKTAGIIEGYPKVVSPEGLEAIKALQQEKKNALEELELRYNPHKKRLEMLREAKLKEYNDNTWKYDSLYSYLCRKYGLPTLISREDLYNGPLDYFGDSPEAIADMEKFKMLGDMRLSSYNEYVDLLKKSVASQGGTAYTSELAELQRYYDEQLKSLQKSHAVFSDDYSYILNRYAKFPKTFKGLFGSLANVNVVTDRMGNPWFEVDVPLDIATRNLIFNKVGDINSGSLLSLLQNAAKSLKTSLRDSIVKSGTNILNEYYFWKNLKTDKNLLENIYAGAVEKIPTTLRPKVQQGLDDAAVDELLRNTVGRRIAAFLKDEAAGLVPTSSTNIMKKGVDEARQALESVKIGLFPDLTFDLTELRVAKGFVNGPRTFVGYRESLPLVEKFLTLVHEGDHIVDTVYPLSPTLLKVINEAFDENFLELPKRLKYYKLWGYKGMEYEATTTTTEARASLLNRYNIFDSPIEAQNNFISSLSDQEIFNTIENVNGYGRYYIDWLRRNKKLTPEKAELFRLAMIVCAKAGEINKGSVIGTTSRRSLPLMPARSHPLVDLFRLLWPTWTNGSLGYGHKYRAIGRNKGLHDTMKNGIRSKAKEYNDIDEVYWAQDAPLREYTKKSPLLLRYDKNGKAVFRTGNDLNPVSSAKNPISFWDPNVTLHGRWPFYSGYHEIPKTEEGIKHAEMLNNLNRFIETPVRKGAYGYLYYRLLDLLFNNKLSENKKDQAN